MRTLKLYLLDEPHVQIGLELMAVEDVIGVIDAAEGDIKEVAGYTKSMHFVPRIW